MLGACGFHLSQRVASEFGNVLAHGVWVTRASLSLACVVAVEMDPNSTDGQVDITKMSWARPIPLEVRAKVDECATYQIEHRKAYWSELAQPVQNL